MGEGEWCGMVRSGSKVTLDFRNLSQVTLVTKNYCGQLQSDIRLAQISLISDFKVTL